MKRIIAKICIFIFVITSILLIVQNNVPVVVETSSEVTEMEVGTGEAGFTLGSLNGCNMNQMYYLRAGHYCGGIAWLLPRRSIYSETQEHPWIADGNLSNIQQQNTYALNKTTPMTQTVAYAKWQGASDADMQNIIWAAGDWKDYNGGATPLLIANNRKIYSSSGGIVGRSQQFANFVYIGLGNNDTLGLSCLPSTDSDAESRVQIVVDQTNKTYTAGPYTLNIAHQWEGLKEGGDNIANLVWREITGQNPGQTSGNQFCWGSMGATVTFQNGTTKNTSIQVLDANGNSVTGNFPYFGQDFYVRYTTNESEGVVEKIKPNASVSYKTKMTGTAYTYRSTEIEYNMIQDNGGLLYKALDDYLHYYKEKMSSNRWLYRMFLSPLTFGSSGSGTISYDLNSAMADTSITLIKDHLTDQFQKAAIAGNYEGTMIYGRDMDVGLETGLFIYGTYYKNGSVTAEIKTKPHYNQETYYVGTKTGRTANSAGELYYGEGEASGEISYSPYTWYVVTNRYDGSKIYEGDQAGAANAAHRPPSTNMSTSTRDRWIWGGSSTENAATAESWKSQAGQKYVESRTRDVPSGRYYYYGVVSGSVSYKTADYLDSAQDAINDINNWVGNNVFKGFEVVSLKIKEANQKMQPVVTLGDPTPGADKSESTVLGQKEINMFIGGNVWEDMPSLKLGDYTGIRNSTSLNLSGIQVQLYDDTSGSKAGATMTDEQGEYGFQKINPMHKYHVAFIYDGMQYEQTKYTDNLSGGYSTGQENYIAANNRNNFNDKFDRIESSPQNYYSNGTWRKAYGLYVKIENASQNYIQYSNDECKKYGYEQTQGETNYGSFRYYDALQIYNYLLKNSHNFNRTNKATMTSSYLVTGVNASAGILDDKYNSASVLNSFRSVLQSLGIASGEITNIWNYIMDTRISATTISYPKENRFVLENIDNLNGGTTIGAPYLYSRTSDQSRNVDFGIRLRQNADMWLGKDVYKATMLINGKSQEYIYNKKKSETDSAGNWYLNIRRGDYEFKVNADGNGNGGTATSDAERKAGNPDYKEESKGGTVYSREVRKSEYLYDGSDVGTTDNKNLQVFVTYRIALKNQAQSIWTSVDEIVDYYDKDQYTFNKNYTIIANNTFVGDRNGNKLYDLNVSSNSTYQSKYGNMTEYYKNSNNINGMYNYDSLYLTNIHNGTATGLRPGEFAYVYITFKVNNDPATGKVKLDKIFDSEFSDLGDSIGKRNIAEINGYSTYYQNGTKAGVIDLDSSAGSLKAKDLDGDGNIISSSNSWENRLEDDTDKAPNIKLKIASDRDIRNISGYVFEDERTEVSDAALVGNGKMDDSEAKVNGVKVELVELVQEVNAQGFSTGNYTGEYVWSSVNYTRSGNAWAKNENGARYYSGFGQAKVILTGPGMLSVNPTVFEESDRKGKYRFDSLPPGDFFIRFTYGDTTQTIFTNTNDDVQSLLNSLTDENKVAFTSGGAGSGILGTTGLNEKSYTGQDYKSTIYQAGVNQSASYNGISGYNSSSSNGYEKQNFTNGRNYSNAKENMYYYNIAESDRNKVGAYVSDAKDVYKYRQDEQEYSKGNNSPLGGGTTLKNHRGEVLISGTNLITTATAKMEEAKGDQAKLLEAARMQREAVEELASRTKMVAQSGVINTQIEYNRTQTQNQVVNNTNIYNLEHIDLGLVLRPEAQVLLSKELTNIQIRLANGQILFDTNQTVNNLYFGKHKNYTDSDFYSRVSKNGSTTYRLRHDIQTAVENRQEELVYATMDEELIQGATIRLAYKLTLDNIGEVDYLDKQFYYTGKTKDTSWSNIAKTNAKTVIDYVSNEIRFNNDYQDAGDIWNIITRGQLINDSNRDNNYVNEHYKSNLDTYNVLIKTSKLSDELVPRCIDMSDNKENSKRETTLVLSTLITGSIETKNLIYTNLVEVLETSNTAGRRMALSTSGNQPVPYQSENKEQDESSKWFTPTELDADSSQRTRVGVPTGENRNYVVPACIALVILSIIGAGVLIIKSKILKKK